MRTLLIAMAVIVLAGCGGVDQLYVSLQWNCVGEHSVLEVRGARDGADEYRFDDDGDWSSIDNDEEYWSLIDLCKTPEEA